jgi:hypothetical protein
LDVIGKISRLLLHAIQSPPTANFIPPYGFLGLQKFTATAENGRGAWFFFVYLSK